MKKIWILLPVFLLLLSACAAPAATNSTDMQESKATAEPAKEDAVSAATMERYREGELREYNGEKLDPAVGPSDNSIKGIQQVDISTYTLTVDGLANKPLTYTYDDVKKLPSEERLLRLYCVEGWNANILWKGVPMKTLLEASGPEG